MGVSLKSLFANLLRCPKLFAAPAAPLPPTPRPDHECVALPRHIPTGHFFRRPFPPTHPLPSTGRGLGLFSGTPVTSLALPAHFPSIPHLHLIAPLSIALSLPCAAPLASCCAPPSCRIAPLPRVVSCRCHSPCHVTLALGTSLTRSKACVTPGLIGCRDKLYLLTYIDNKKKHSIW